MHISGAIVSDWAACIAAVAAAASLYFARQTVREAEAARKDAERDRQRHQLERISKLVESLDMAAHDDMRYNPPTDSWLYQRNQLRIALVASPDIALPHCLLMVAAATPAHATTAAATARGELRVEMERLAETERAKWRAKPIRRPLLARAFKR